MKMLSGALKKMQTKIGSPVEYTLMLGEDALVMNTFLGKHVKLKYLGEIFCVQCGRKTNKSFQQGHCFPCMRKLQECDMCIIHPERCHVEEGTCPKDDWAHAQCYQDHIVYLANASGLKVGITRHTQVPTRWIDQGALQALPIFKVKNRYQSGVVEVALKAFVSDRTNWRAMLKNTVEMLDLKQERDRLLKEAEGALATAIASLSEGAVETLDENECRLEFPVLEYPEKVKSHSFDKTDTIEGVLQGIKGQYLILDTGVLNIRKFGGYAVELVS